MPSVRVIHVPGTLVKLVSPLWTRGRTLQVSTVIMVLGIGAGVGGTLVLANRKLHWVEGVELNVWDRETMIDSVGGRTSHAGNEEGTMP